ncbi:hypothetical protein NDL49_004795, partial [Escherichia coli]|nr:hypothetical protein [Escherichia coli]
KIRAINDLKQATDHKERLSETLESVTQDITALAKSAALNVSRVI